MLKMITVMKSMTSVLLRDSIIYLSGAFDSKCNLYRRIVNKPIGVPLERVGK
jgi:hypothetical protein